MVHDEGGIVKLRREKLALDRQASTAGEQPVLRRFVFCASLIDAILTATTKVQLGHELVRAPSSALRPLLAVIQKSETHSGKCRFCDGWLLPEAADETGAWQ